MRVFYILAPSDCKRIADEGRHLLPLQALLVASPTATPSLAVAAIGKVTINAAAATHNLLQHNQLCHIHDRKCRARFVGQPTPVSQKKCLKIRQVFF